MDGFFPCRIAFSPTLTALRTFLISASALPEAFCPSKYRLIYALSGCCPKIFWQSVMPKTPWSFTILVTFQRISAACCSIILACPYVSDFNITTYGQEHSWSMENTSCVANPRSRITPSISMPDPFSTAAIFWNALLSVIPPLFTQQVTGAPVSASTAQIQLIISEFVCDFAFPCSARPLSAA